MLETLDHTIRIGSTPTFLYFDLNMVELASLNSVVDRLVHERTVFNSTLMLELFIHDKSTAFIHDRTCCHVGNDEITRLNSGGVITTWLL